MRYRPTYFLLSFLLLFFCGRLPGQILQNKPDVTISYGDHLVIGVLSDKKFDLNPFQITSPIHEEIIQMIYGYGLTKIPDKVVNPPDLIARYIETDDARIWRMVLERNINFQNGRRLSNDDVVFTFEVVKKHGGFNLNRKLDFSNLKSVSIKGDLEIIFELYEPDKSFNLKIADIPILSRSYYQGLLKFGYEYFNERKPLGMGPFEFETQAENMLTLKSSPFYYSGQPFLDRIKLQFFDDEQELIDALVNGDVDYIELPDENNARSIYDLMGSRIVVFGIPRTEVQVTVMLFNVKSFPLSQSEVRQAIYAAVNRRQIVDRFISSTAEVANTLVPASSPHYKKSLFNRYGKNLEYDPEVALRMLRRAGWRPNQQNLMARNNRPLSFKLLFSQNSELEANIARSITIDLSELNIQVQPTPVLPFEKKERLENSDYQAMIYTYTYHPEYLSDAVEKFYFEVLGARQRVPNYQNGYMDGFFKLVEDKKNFRENSFDRLQTFARDEMPAVFLFFQKQILIGLSNRFYEFRSTFQNGPDFFYRMNPIDTWFVPKEKQKYK